MRFVLEVIALDATLATTCDERFKVLDCARPCAVETKAEGRGRRSFSPCGVVDATSTVGDEDDETNDTSGIRILASNAIHGIGHKASVLLRHNLERDILVDICFKVGIMVRKEAPMGFLSGDGKDLRPADLLLFNWLQGKDACLDVTCISPFAGMGATSCAPRVALHNAVEKKKKKYGSKRLIVLEQRLLGLEQLLPHFELMAVLEQCLLGA
ncbi:hypothetical protein Tco_0719919 [Tanacetum coccineum]